MLMSLPHFVYSQYMSIVTCSNLVDKVKLFQDLILAVCIALCKYVSSHGFFFNLLTVYSYV